MRRLALWPAGILALMLWALAPAAPAAQLAGPPRTDSLIGFRVDVSRRPQIGVVVTATGQPKQLPGSAFTVRVGRTSPHPSVRRLSPGDLQLIFGPEVQTSLNELQLERSAAAHFLVGLPAGARSAVTFAGRPTADPATAASMVLELVRGPRQSAAARLTAALAAFSSGAAVRRTVVLVVTASEPLARAADDHFARQLAASGTQLYVLDATRRGAGAFAALAAQSGGRTLRVNAPGDWQKAFGRIVEDLNNQYYLRFTDRLPLPHRALISVQTSTARASRVVSLPAKNPAPVPVAAPAPAQPPIALPLGLLALAAVGLVIAYGVVMLVASRREPRARLRGHRSEPSTAGEGSVEPADLFFVFLMPCLNEEKVILNSLHRLLSIPGDNFAVMVIDDGSDDHTADLVAGVDDERVWLLRRTPPDARQGKGEALNAAISRLGESGWLREHDLENVVVAVVDADGRLDPHSLDAVTPYFADPRTGAVQIGVRINNRGLSRLARMQDMEFVIFTEVFQRGRRHLGSVGLGGNGQFMRVSALRSLGEAPWSRSLTEDLDLGIRLLTAGWRNEYCHTAAVHQQGVVGLRRLIRQRSRWFQGHLQSWKLVPTILRDAPRSARADLLYHLSSPAILLIASVLTTSFVFSLFGSAFIAAQGGNPVGWWVASTYLLAVGPALLQSSTYWLRERENGVSLGRTALLAHMYVCYSLMWYAAGWWAVGRTLRRRTNWAKTDRVAEVPLAASGAIAVATLMPSAAGAPTALLAASARSDPQAQPGPAAETGPPQRSRRPRRIRVIATVAAVTFVALGVALRVFDHGGRAMPSQWYQVFNGYGHTSVSGSGPNETITLSEATTHLKSETHAALVLSRAWYQDFVASADVHTIRQLRAGRAGAPNPWEVGWIVWRYSSPQRFYALTLEPNGWLLSKQDPAYPGSERFLASGRLPRFPIGATYRVGIVQVGDQIVVSADGRLLTKFTDKQRPYTTGGFGMYAEDAVVRFSAVHVRALPRTAPTANS